MLISIRLLILHTEFQTTKTIDLTGGIDYIYYAGTGSLLLRSLESVSLYDIQQKSLVLSDLGYVEVSGLKFGFMSKYFVSCEKFQKLTCSDVDEFKTSWTTIQMSDYIISYGV